MSLLLFTVYGEAKNNVDVQCCYLIVLRAACRECHACGNGRGSIIIVGSKGY